MHRLPEVMVIGMLVFQIFIVSSSAMEAGNFDRLLATSNFSTVLASFQNGFESNSSNDLRSNVGAIISVYADSNATHIEDRWHCQLQTHRQYCELHGYHCIVVSDSELWKQERKAMPLSTQATTDYWMKVQVLRSMLPNYPWILYLDTDSIFLDPSSSRAVEAIFPSLAQSGGGPSIFVPDYRGWGTDVILFRNTPVANAFIEYVWQLRFACPYTVGEQGAFHVALLDAMLSIMTLNEEVLDIARDDSHSCCIPRQHCDYPTATSHENSNSFDFQRKRNNYASFHTQGCVWYWQDALRKTVYLKTNMNMDVPHVLVHAAIRGRDGLWLQHPVKEMNCSRGG